MTLRDILVTPLSRVNTAGGDVLHAMKRSDLGYEGFGEAYFSWVKCGAVKAWKRHTKMTMNVIVPVGHVRFVFCEINTSGIDEFRIEDIGLERYVRVTVPAGIWFGFRGCAETSSLILNIASIPHDPTELERKSVSDINYEW